MVPRRSLTDDGPRADSLVDYKRVEPGDLVLNRMRAFQGAVGVAGEAGVVSPDYAVLRMGPLVDSHFCHFLFRSPWFVGEMISRLRGIGSTELGNARTPRVNVADLQDILLPVPPIEEQARVVTDLAAVRANVETTWTLWDRQVELLQELRRSLITSAVSGEFDVSTTDDSRVKA